MCMLQKNNNLKRIGTKRIHNISKPIKKLYNYSNSNKDNADNSFEIERKVINNRRDMKLEESIMKSVKNMKIFLKENQRKV